MTPNNTKNLDTGLLGFDAANTRVRRGRSSGEDGFAEVFDAQVRGAGRTPSRNDGGGRPDRPETAAPRSDRSSKANGTSKAETSKPEERSATAADEARAGARTEEGAAEESTAAAPGNAAEAQTGTADGEETSELTPEQLLAALGGNTLPVDEQADAAATGVPAATPATDATNTADTADTEGEPVLFNALAATADSEAAPETADDGLTVPPQGQTGARTTAAATAAVRGDQATKPATERPADDLLTAFRFSRMMSQENGVEKAALDATGLIEGKPTGQSAQRGPDFLNLLNGMGPTPPGREAAPSAAQAPATPSIPVPLNRAGWDQAFNERVVWMARQGIQEAHIQVTPREMGPIEVRISVQQDQATVAFTANNVVARDAIEAAMPRLRDMLADSGLNLVQSEVSQQSPQERGDGREHLGGRGGPQVGGAESDGTDIGTEVSHADSGRGMVDFFA